KSRDLLLIIKKRKVKYLGHVLRHERYQLLQLILMGKANDVLEGGRSHGCATSVNGPTLFRLAQDCQKFAELTANFSSGEAQKERDRKVVNN
ncbi:jg5133, partial [Pararge aegeria aegeria]